MNLDDAFMEMLTTKGMAKQLDIKRGTFSTMQYDVKTKRKEISMERKISLLQQAGYTVTIEVTKNEAP